MYRCSGLVVALLLNAQSGHAGGDYPVFAGDELALGRTTWVENCETCHAYGIAGAPLSSDTTEWQQRAAQGRAALYQHAIEGFFGPGGTMMPPRGGNDALSDAEVKAAVDYMLELAAHEQ